MENEPGIHAAPRDYSETAEKLFQAELPAEVSEFVLEKRDAVATTVWQEAGAVRNGNWRAFLEIRPKNFFLLIILQNTWSRLRRPESSALIFLFTLMFG